MRLPGWLPGRGGAHAELTAPEQAEPWELVRRVRNLLGEAEYKSDGFYIGLNDGIAAGQMRSASLKHYDISAGSSVASAALFTKHPSGPIGISYPR